MTVRYLAKAWSWSAWSCMMLAAAKRDFMLLGSSVKALHAYHVHEYSPHSYNLQQLLTTDADEPAVCAFAAMSSAGRSEVGLPNNAI
jgi:hypothetical protein